MNKKTKIQLYALCFLLGLVFYLFKFHYKLSLVDIEIHQDEFSGKPAVQIMQESIKGSKEEMARVEQALRGGVVEPSENIAEGGFRYLSENEANDLKLRNYEQYLRYQVSKQRYERGDTPYQAPLGQEDQQIIVNQAIKQRLIDEVNARKSAN